MRVYRKRKPLHLLSRYLLPVPDEEGNLHIAARFAATERLATLPCSFPAN